MKRYIITAFALLFMGGAMMAQNVIKTYDACDATQDGNVTAADAATVVEHALKSTKSSNVVTAEQLLSLLQRLDSKLDYIDSRLTTMETKTGNAADTSDPYRGHEYVDLGIVVNGKTVLYATCNLGAAHEYDYGGYYAWGETVPKTSFGWDSYRWCEEGWLRNITKYCHDTEFAFEGETDALRVLEAADDAATQNWGGVWRTPTKDELQALIDNCTWTWVAKASDNGFNGVSGYKVSSKTDASKYIFLPNAGYYLEPKYGFEGEGLCSTFWSSSLSDPSSGDESAYATQLIAVGDVEKDGQKVYMQTCRNVYRCYGFSIRPVCFKQ